MTERAAIEAAIAALEAQRPALGDAVVDAAVAPLYAKLTALDTDPRKAEGAQQLKHVAILFVDVVGSTAMSGQLDPEDIVEVIDTALGSFTAEVQAHHGKVLQFTGDGLLAVFGADAADEQGAENAVHAGLAIIAQASRLAAGIAARHDVHGFNVRAGIDCGQVLLGGGVDAENTIRGSAVNLAARMEQSAPIGTLRISHNAWRQVRGVFDVAEELALHVKGIEAPVRSYLVLRARPRALRATARGIDGLETPMVGRDEPLGQLQRAFKALVGPPDDAPAPRTTTVVTVVTVVADAGVGKSRLLQEFERWAAAQAEPVNCFRARAQPQTRQQPYGLLHDLLAGWLHVADSDSAEAARGKFVAGLAPLFADEGDEPVHLVGHLIGLDFSTSPHLRGILADPRQIRARGFHAAAQIFRRSGTGTGTGRPTLLLLDDLQWADDGSLDFLRHLIDASRDLALLVLAFTRPLLFEHRPAWGDEDAGAIRIPLTPLGLAHSGALADALLHQIDEVPAALRELVTGHGDGNPFFMEEIVKMLLDEGAIVAGEAGRWRVSAEHLQAARVPTTLTGVLQARLAVLRTEERVALQQASVIGFQFWDQALAALDAQSPRALDRLAGREFVVAQAQSTFEGAREFTFQHHLMHQFTYESMLKRDRRAYHASAAAWLAALASERGVEYLGATGEHHERAGQPAEAASYYTRAAESAAARDAREAAFGYVARALALVAADDHAAQWRLIATREKLLANGDDRARHGADLDALQALGEALADDARRAEALWRRAAAHLAQGEYLLADGVARQSLALAERAGDKAIAARSQGSLAIARRRMGDFGAARRHAEAGLALARQGTDRAVEGRLLRNLASLAAESGDAQAGHELETQCITIARESGDRGLEVDALNSLGDNCIRLGDYAAARRHLEDSRRLADRIGRPDIESLVWLNLAAIAHLQGDDATAVEHATVAARIALAIGARDLEAAACLPLGLAEAGLGNGPAARAALERSRDLFEQNAGPHLALEPTAGLALLDLAQGDVAAALTEVEKVLAHLAAGGRLDGTEEPLRISLACFRVLAAAGDPRAADVLATAHTELLARAQRIADPAARQRFLHEVPHHQAIALAHADNCVPPPPSPPCGSGLG